MTPDLYPFGGLVPPIGAYAAPADDTPACAGCALSGTPELFAGPLFDFADRETEHA